MYPFPEPRVQFGGKEAPALADAISERVGRDDAFASEALDSSWVESEKLRGFLGIYESLLGCNCGVRGDPRGRGALLTSVEAAKTLDVVRGLEGEAAHTYLRVFDHLITISKGAFFFRERSRRPPLDNVNALLSFLYTLLVRDTEAALEGVGLDPAVGFLHCDRPGRPGLALDLMEEFRPFLADRLALSLINRRQVDADGFRATESGAVTMDDDTRKAVLVAWQQRKQEEIQHPFLGERIAAGLLPYAQALLLARHLRGDLDGYPAFFWR